MVVKPKNVEQKTAEKFKDINKKLDPRPEILNHCAAALLCAAKF